MARFQPRMNPWLKLVFVCLRLSLLVLADLTPT